MPVAHPLASGHANPRVLVCGDVINDVLVEAAGQLVPGDDNPASIRVQPGGSAANQAAWMASLGLDVVFAGRAGAADAEFHRGELARLGVEPKLVADSEAATGSIVVLIGPDGERTMITDRGANLNLRPADVPAGLLDGADLLHLTGYTLFTPGSREVARLLIAAARRRGVPFTIDPSSAAFLGNLAPGEFLAWTGGAAACFPNLDEAAVLVRQERAAGPVTSTVPAGPARQAVRAVPATGQEQLPGPADLAAALARHYGAVALKLGPAGAVLATGDATPVHVAAVPAPVRDTTGAGDAFCAGYLAAWLAGSSPAAAARAGAQAAARAVSVLGGRPVRPGRTRPARE